MALTVVGSIAFDSVRTPFGERERMLGGSASHFALAASFFTDVRVVGPVGDDFGADEIGVLQSHGISTTDVEHVEGGRTFFWRGHYDHDMNIAHTDETQLNVFADFVPKLCEENRSAEMLFLGNIQPELQRQVREEADGARFVALDSMNLWIETARDPLLRVIGMIDCVLLNDAELRMLTGESNLVVAAHRIMEHGPTIVVVKRGEYGAALFTGDDTFAMPALPIAEVRDPTGAGDSFAGGFLGFLDGLGAHSPSNGELRQAMVRGSALASFNVEDFGTERVRRLEREDIDARVAAFKSLTHF
ncbi:MAG TPA: PfkB family carbohydrate kinase [Solirubrobacterales bacterium]|nr:PfkB family carbohydrate kinase [Solirubrobacterales bacterium]